MKLKTMCLFAVVLIAGVANAVGSITDVTAKQRYPWNGKVDICFNLSEIDATNRVLFVRAIDREMGVTNVAEHIAGDTSYFAGAHHIVWDMAADGLNVVSTNVIFGVWYREPPLYCVIDLSEGAAATNYPVSYLFEVPAGGWSDEYKTEKLVLRRIKAGTFTMGGRSTDFPGASDEGLHQVTGLGSNPKMLQHECRLALVSAVRRA